jgi:putrescine importer
MPSEPQTTVPAPATAVSQPHLRRVLGLRDLVFYGIVLIQPVGAIGPFGGANQQSFGHVTTTILIAMVAMMFTAMSYGRMAALYPSAGSAYTYVGRGLNPHLGFLAGWAMILDYLVIPIVSIVYGAISAVQVVNDLLPNFNHQLAAFLHLPFDETKVVTAAWIVFFTILITLLNLRGIKWTAHANQILLAAMSALIVWFVVDAVAYIVSHQGWLGLFSGRTLYNPGTFKLGAICGATSFVALTYVGFDGITTLAEDAKEPKRTMPYAIVLTCFIIGICAAVEVYLAQIIWPDYTTYKNPDTAFFDVCKMIGGSWLFNFLGVVMAIACIGSALTGQVGAARLLFGMGRDNALPRFFAKLDKRSNPALNVLLIGCIVLGGALLLDYEAAATLVNFGAFLAFIGVNAAAIREFVGRPPAGHKRNWTLDLVVPLLGFAFCLTIWLELKGRTQIVGGIWCAIGLIYAAINTRGFRKAPVMIDLSGI